MYGDTIGWVFFFFYKLMGGAIYSSGGLNEPLELAIYFFILILCMWGERICDPDPLSIRA